VNYLVAERSMDIIPMLEASIALRGLDPGVPELGKRL